jgi:ribonuclease Z
MDCLTAPGEKIDFSAAVYMVFFKKSSEGRRMKRTVFFVVMSVLVLVPCACQRMMEGIVEKALNRQAVEMLTDGRLHVILVGSGGPMNNTARVSSCTAVIAGGEFLLVDVGPGSIRNADLQNLPLGALSGVLLTHFHSDHISDLGEANFQSWVNGRQKALEIHGPEGVEKVVGGFTQAYELDTLYRIAHHGEDVMPPGASTPVAKTISFPDQAMAEPVFKRNGLAVYAFLVDHSPVKPAVGYRFEYKGNTVVLTGDARMTDSLVRQARNADILICDALSNKNTELIARVAAENNRPRIAKIFHDISGYHMTPVQAAGIARDAGAGKLVLYHLVPPVTNFIVKRAFMDGVSDVYRGNVVLGEDGMIFTLDPKN